MGPQQPALSASIPQWLQKLPVVAMFFVGPVLCIIWLSLTRRGANVLFVMKRFIFMI